MAEKPYDFIIFGATGFTGALVVEQMAKVAGEHPWAIAGRSEEKLLQTRSQISQKMGMSLANVPMIVADVSDERSLVSMARQAKVVLNCVGPFRWYGEPVVKACIENGADNVDISGEEEYMETVAMKYNDIAQTKGVYVVGGCSWNAVPCDVGIQYTMRIFDGQLDSVETVADPNIPNDMKIHYATLQTLVESAAHKNELKALRRSQKVAPLPKPTHKQRKRGCLFWHEGVNGWCVPFMGADASVIDRTMHYNYEKRQWRPVQVQTYMKVPNLFMGIGFRIWQSLFNMMCSSRCGRSLLLKHPKLFSAGKFTHEGPSQEHIDVSTFRTWIFGTGWSGRKMGPNEQAPDAPKDKITCVIDGPEPGYIATAAFVVASAMTLLEDRKLLPSRGGVFPSGAAFANTQFFERMSDWGITFKKLD